MPAAEHPSTPGDDHTAATVRGGSVRERVSLADGTTVLVRSVEPDDADALAAGYQQLSATTAYRRFFTTYPQLSPQQVRYFTAVDHHDHEALGAVTTSDTDTDHTDTDGGDGEGEGVGEGVGIARYIRDPDDPGCAELAVVVVDAWQRRGVGVQLMRVLCDRARDEDITRLRADVLSDNPAMLALLRRFGTVHTRTDGPTTLATLHLAAADLDR